MTADKNGSGVTGAASEQRASAAIIIPHYNDVTRLGKCLDALVPQMDGAAVELVVVDNGSTDDLTPVLRRHPGLRVVREEQKGAAPARNRGVAETEAAWLFFIDADCVVADDWLRTAMALGGLEGIIGGRVEVFDETPPPRSGAEAFETVFAFPQRLYVEQQNFSVTANLLTTRAVFEATGPFDGRVVEDSDWCQRAVALGYPIVYRDELIVSHPTRGDWASLRRKWHRTCRENYFKNGTAPIDRMRWAMRSLLVLASGPVHVPKVLRHPALASGDRLPAIATLLRLRAARAGWMLRQAVFGERPLNT